WSVVKIVPPFSSPVMSVVIGTSSPRASVVRIVSSPMTKVVMRLPPAAAVADRVDVFLLDFLVAIRASLLMESREGGSSLPRRSRNQESQPVWTVGGIVGRWQA